MSSATRLTRPFPTLSQSQLSEFEYVLQHYEHNG